MLPGEYRPQEPGVSQFSLALPVTLPTLFFNVLQSYNEEINLAALKAKSWL